MSDTSQTQQGGVGGTSVSCLATHLSCLFGNPHFQHSQSGHDKRASIRRHRPTKQAYKLNRTLLVAISLPWVVNHSVCQGGLCCLCTICHHFKAVGGGRTGGGRVLSSFSDSRSTSKDPVYNIRSSTLFAQRSSEEAVLDEALTVQQVGTAHFTILHQLCCFF